MAGQDRLAHARVQPRAAQRRQAVVERRPHQRVRERVAPDPPVDLLEHLRVDRLVERGDELVAGQRPERLEQPVVDLAPDHRGDLHRLARRRRQPRDPPRRDLAHAGGDARVLEVAAEAARALAQVADDLLDEERVALGLGVQRGDELGRGRLGPERGHQLADLRLREAAQRHLGEHRLAPQRGDDGRERVVVGELAGAVGAEEHRAPRLRRADQVADELQRRAVGPLQVVEHEQQRGAGRDLRQQRGERVEQAMALGAAFGAAHRRRAGRRAELGQQRGEVGGARPEPLRRAGQRRAARPAAQHLEHGPVGAGAGLVEAAVEHDRAVAVDLARELRRHARLADPGLARDEHEPPLVGDRRVPRPAQRRERLAPPDERVPPRRRGERGRQRARRGRARRRGVGRRRVAAQEPLVDLHHRGPRRRAELVAQQLAQLVERAQRLGRVAARLVGLHQQPVRRLAERREPDRRARGMLGRVELAPAEPQARLAERLQRAQPQPLDLAPPLAHPGPVALGQERLGAERQRGPRLRGGVAPAPVVERLHGDLDGVGERLRVDPQRLGQRQAQLGAAGQRVGPERAAQLREQRGERGVRGGGRVLGPQHVLELVARAGPRAVADEVGEQQLSLAPGQRAAGQSVATADRDPTAQADLPPDMLRHRRRTVPGAPTFRQGRANRCRPACPVPSAR